MQDAAALSFRIAGNQTLVKDNLLIIKCAICWMLVAEGSQIQHQCRITLPLLSVPRDQISTAISLG